MADEKKLGAPRPATQSDGRSRIDRTQLATAYRQGATMRQLARRFGVSRQRIRTLLGQAQVPLRGPRRFPAEAQWWREQVDGGRSPADLAAELGCSTMTVWRKLRATRTPDTFAAWLERRTSDDGQCLRWQRGHSSDGYSVVFRDGRRVFAHVIVWQHHFGPIEEGQRVAHRCAHRDCVRIDHLYLTDAAGRVADTVAQG